MLLNEPLQLLLVLLILVRRNSKGVYHLFAQGFDTELVSLVVDERECWLKVDHGVSREFSHFQNCVIAWVLVFDVQLNLIGL